MTAKAKKKPSAGQGGAVPADESGDGRLSFYPSWCKRCGNCVAFCPRNALEKDEWGGPRLARPERCTACGLCEMLCPDFAIAVGEAAAPEGAVKSAREGSLPAGGGDQQRVSPERLAPGPRGEDV